ncbi:MAG TPA: hypothetical protein VGO06_27840 [Bosea sp. (in: a-proteobacteria)]|uniref:hypothetical protein n=1 Tax=Bosea sp. (in: a-proteobacteria) TaxID=1871050 RepID=UPI002E154713|nr:hypothetical protein [Bosea sp. (in: a-proteobacteria)]
MAKASGENFLDLCEAYELAWAGLDHWSHKPGEIKQLDEYRDLIAALEVEVLNIIRSGGK